MEPMEPRFSTMVLTILLLALAPALIKCSGDGNIHLLEEEVRDALKACANTANDFRPNRQRRSNEFANDDQYGASSPRIDGNSRQETNQYNHERRNSTNREQLAILNATEYDYAGYGTGSDGEKFVNTVPRPALGNNYNASSSSANRTKRGDPLMNNVDADQCLSQCVFANLQVVDLRGIPREAELWNKVQSSVTSQQSRAVLKDQIRACFQELQSEAEDNGCSYSNKLERCLMLLFADRKNSTHATTTNMN